MTQFLEKDLHLDKDASNTWMRHWIGDGLKNLDQVVGKNSGHVCLRRQRDGGGLFHCAASVFGAAVWG